MAEHDPTEHFEHAEHAEHAAHDGNPFLITVSVTIALLAVAAATVGSFETIETSAVTIAKNEAVLFQNKATDNWNFVQAKSIKKNMYDNAAAAGGPKADDFVKQSKKNETEQEDIRKKAEEFEHKSEAKLEASEVHEKRHHVLTVAVTMLHISIAIATIAIITRGMRWPWYCSLALGAVGLGTAAWAYIH
jgi:hypothetical protein